MVLRMKTDLEKAAQADPQAFRQWPTESAARICCPSGFHGVMNVDVRLKAGTGNAFLIESNPRFWGSLASTAGCGLKLSRREPQEFEPDAVPRQLASGRFHMHHPLLRPSSWWQLASDPGEQGRLLRARTFDAYSLCTLTQEAPSMATRFAGRSTVAAWKHACALFAGRAVVSSRGSGL